PSATARLSIVRLRPPPTPTLFPYTTLFRSLRSVAGQLLVGVVADAALAGLRAHTRFLARRAGRAARAHAARSVSVQVEGALPLTDRKSTRLNSSHVKNSYAVFCLKKKKQLC